MAATGLSSSRGSAAWPADVPTPLNDLAAAMVEESVEQLLNRPEALVGAIVNQWVLGGGERSQRAAGAVWSV
eukprot:15481853-Alexandrium_andersonii.AAC.1